MIELRNYQIDIIEKTIISRESTLIQIPTGGGKTVIAKEIISALIDKYDMQVLFVAPKIILMEQTANVFASLNPQVMHGLEPYSKNHHLLISTIQTASRRDLEPDVLIIDEIHYGFGGKMIEKLMKDKPNTRIIGLSATPYDKNGKILKGFNLILNQYDLKYMIENHYLVDIKSYQLTRIKNLGKVKLTGGDYNLKDLSKIVSDNQTILEIVESSLDYLVEYKKAIVFAVDINHAELLTKAYIHAGVSTVSLHSKMAKSTISKEILRFKNGDIKVLVSVLMLTTGFDVPDTDVAIIARPTKSQNLYKQMVGRVLRPAPNKTHAILLDCGNVIENLGLPLESIKEIETKETTNKHRCTVCHSENLMLKKEASHSYWICKDCHHKKEIEQGTFECKICKRKYTHDAKFEIINDKLYLVCEDCPYPSLISEFTGNEVFVQVKPKKESHLYLPFEEARRFILSLNLKSKKAWNRLVEDVKIHKIRDFPSSIPLDPNIVYQNKGWKNTLYWIGISDDNIDNTVDEKYLPFEQARGIIHTLGLKSKKGWYAFVERIQQGGSHPNFSDAIPLNPEIVYQNHGWLNIDDWIGISKITTEKISDLSYCGTICSSQKNCNKLKIK